MTTLRAQARREMNKGPVTAAYGADLARVLEVLNTSLATELVCVLRYKAHYYGAQGLDADPIAAEFLEHAGEEQVHAWLGDDDPTSRRMFEEILAEEEEHADDMLTLLQRSN